MGSRTRRRESTRASCHRCSQACCGRRSSSLIGVPCHDVDAALQRAKLLDVVSVEVEEEAALALVVSVVRTALIDVGLACLLEGVALPSEGGVLGDDDRTTRSVVVTEVHVELSSGRKWSL